MTEPPAKVLNSAFFSHPPGTPLSATSPFSVVTGGDPATTPAAIPAVIPAVIPVKPSLGTSSVPSRTSTGPALPDLPELPDLLEAGITQLSESSESSGWLSSSMKTSSEAASQDLRFSHFNASEVSFSSSQSALPFSSHSPSGPPFEFSNRSSHSLHSRFPYPSSPSSSNPLGYSPENSSRASLGNSLGTSVKSQIQYLSEQTSRLNFYIQEVVKSSHLRWEQLQSTTENLKQDQEILKQEVTKTLDSFTLKVNESKNLDLKTQEMVDRQNSILRTYEVRLHQLQKILTEKESQLFQAQMALSEARSELARLKNG